MGGGIKYWDELAEKKSTLVYDVIDGSDGFYNCPVEKKSRSRMNLPFIIKGGDEALEKKFQEEAKKVKLYQLAGHKSVGGLRLLYTTACLWRVSRPWPTS